MFNNMQEIIDANKAIGNYWFSPSTMEVFESKIESQVICGRYFITSEITFDGKKHVFSARKASDEGRITTVDIEKTDTFEEMKLKISDYINESVLNS